MTQEARRIWPSLAHQRNIIEMSFFWRADVGPPLDVYWGENQRTTIKWKKVTEKCRTNSTSQEGEYYGIWTSL